MGVPAEAREAARDLAFALKTKNGPLLKQLHHQIYNNTNGFLPKALKGFSYNEAQVGIDHDGTRGARRIVVLFDDATGRAVQHYYTPDHYGDGIRPHKPSFIRF